MRSRFCAHPGLDATRLSTVSCLDSKARENKDMAIDDEWPIHFTGREVDVMKWLHDHSIERVRVEYTDFGGVARGKAVALEQFPHTLQHGVAFCATVLAFDMPANVVPGTDYAEARR